MVHGAVIVIHNREVDLSAEFAVLTLSQPDCRF